MIKDHEYFSDSMPLAIFCDLPEHYWQSSVARSYLCSPTLTLDTVTCHARFLAQWTPSSRARLHWPPLAALLLLSAARP